VVIDLLSSGQRILAVCLLPDTNLINPEDLNYPVLHNEKELLARIAGQDDELAFAELVRHYSPIVFRQLVSVITDVHKAEEIGQDVFLVAWRQRVKLADMENVGGYLHVVVRNKARRALREVVFATEEPPQEDFRHGFWLPSHQPAGQEADIEARDLQKLIDQGIAQLPERRREVFRMSRVYRMTYEEIAEELGISRTAVKHHIVGSMAFLKSWLLERGEVDAFIVLLIWLAWQN
jgi:RNA polymerase sigma factor (sigma-70 family)